MNPAEVFATCCPTNGVDRGVCVTPALAGTQADSLTQQECNSGWLCAPREKAEDASFKFPSCRVGGLAGLLTSEGACVPSCIVSASQAALITQSSCAQGELCAPCVDPLSGDSTGSCD